jgi:hypothetical protein
LRRHEIHRLRLVMIGNRYAGCLIHTAKGWTAPSDIMSRQRGRNDILPRLAIARHPQLTTDNSAVSPLDKIALKSVPGSRAKRMECSVHNLPPTRAAKQSLVSCVAMSVTCGTKITVLS